MMLIIINFNWYVSNLYVVFFPTFLFFQAKPRKKKGKKTKTNKYLARLLKQYNTAKLNQRYLT